MEYSPKLDAIPPDILCLDDYERLAPGFMAAEVFAAIAGGSGAEITLRRNREAFDDIALWPRPLRKFTSASTAVTLCGQSFRHPVLLAPVSHHGLVHPQGELATAAGAEAMSAGLVASTLSSVTLEQIAAYTAGSKWFQLYFQPERAATLILLRRAEQAGYHAIVVTVDVPVTGLRYRAQRAGFVHPAILPAANLAAPAAPAGRSLGSGESFILHRVMAVAPSWEDLAWLREQTSLPLLVKGLLHPEDAARAVALGCDGVVVSNHGGRALDGVSAAIEALPAVRRAVGERRTVLLDGGVRRGSDVFKALACGADAVLVGRPQVYALAVAGALGVAHMLRLLCEELELTMALAGTPTVANIGPGSLCRGRVPCGERE